jgi:hypothetical protein
MHGLAHLYGTLNAGKKVAVIHYRPSGELALPRFFPLRGAGFEPFLLELAISQGALTRSFSDAAVARGRAGVPLRDCSWLAMG